MRRNIERWRAMEARLGRETEIWVSTVRADLRPHLVPVWFIYLDEHIYFATGIDTQKWTNLLSNQNITLSLPDPNNVLILEGEAHAVGIQVRNVLAQYFYDKYEWDFTEDNSAEWRVVQVTPLKILAWGDGYDDETTRIL